MIKNIYRRYFQKSKVFLYPLLQLDKKSEEISEVTIESFIHVENADDDLHFLFPLTEPSLTVSFTINLEDKDKRREMVHEIYQKYGKDRHVKKKFYSPDMDRVIIVYTLFDMVEDYDLIVAGRYSKISKTSKLRIQRYYAANSEHWAHVKTFLYPEEHYSMYAEALGVDEETLRNRQELIDNPDLVKETIAIDLAKYKTSLIL